MKEKILRAIIKALKMFWKALKWSIGEIKDRRVIYLTALYYVGVWNFLEPSSMFLGFTIAVLSLLISMKTTVSLSLMVPIISLGIPIMDTSVSFFRRLLKKDNPFRGDKLHIHHILLQSGLSHHHVVILVWVITLLFNIIALCFMLIPGRYSLLILLIFACMVATGIMFLEFIKREKISIK